MNNEIQGIAHEYTLLEKSGSTPLQSIMATAKKTKTDIIAEFLAVSLLIGFAVSIIPTLVLSGGAMLITSNATITGWAFIGVIAIGFATVLFCLYAAADYLAWEHARYYN